MPAAKPRYMPPPRYWNKTQVAAYFGKCDDWFGKAKREELEAKGFPHYDALIGGWDSVAIKAWDDRRNGLASVAKVNSWDDALGYGT